MRLKSLDIQGYKSFAAKATFKFDEGVTAIIGPNGSGKSNVSDAIRWVLGEQSYSALRGKKTEDMIFSGSDGRARLGMAYAALEFDNTDGWLPVDFNEVTVTRRAFRDGQNEYLLNGSRVRLRDINELLAASGLSRRTYTHIGQGLVDAVLSLRAEERRTLFEEAAGITLHNSKRTEALARLDTTQENLLRLNDIVSEITPRLRYLQRQADRAATHLTISGQLKELLRTWYGYQWGEEQRKLYAARQAHRNSQQQLEDQRGQVQQIEKDIEELRARHNQLRLQLGEWHHHSSRLHTEAETAQRDLAVGEERLRLITGQIEELADEIEPLEQSSHATGQQVTEAQSAAESLGQEVAQTKANVSDLEARLEDLKAERRALLKRQSDAEEHVRRVADRIAGHRARLTQLDERRQQLEAEAAEAQVAVQKQETLSAEALARRKSAQAHLEELEGHLSTLNDDRAGHLKTIQELAGAVSRQDEEISGVRRQLDAARTRQDILSRMQEDLTGYYEGVRNVLKKDAGLQGIIGTVAQLLRVPAGMDVAIETALGSHLQDVVVETWSHAEAAIARLKQAHGGRATFLPLDTVRPGTPVEAVQIPGVLGVAADLVGYEPDLEPIARMLLGRTIVVEDLPTARQVLAKARGSFQIVTLEGDLTRSGGSVSGGSSRNKSGGGFLARQREWQELPVTISKLEESLNATQKQRTVLEEQRTQEQSALESITQRQAKEQAAHSDAERSLYAVERDVERAQQAADWQRDLLSRHQERRTELDELQTQLETEIQQLEAEQDSLAAEASRVAAQAGDLTYESLLTQLNQAQTVKAEVDGRFANQRTILENFQKQLEELNNRLAAKRRRASELTDEKDTLQARLETLRDQTGLLNDQIAQLAAKIQPAETELTSKERLLEQRGQAEARQRKLLQRFETETGQLHLEYSRRQDEMKLLQRQIVDDLGLVEVESGQDLMNQPPLPLHPLISKLPKVTELPPDLEEDVRQLRAQLSRLGTVNMDAPQEFEETQQRHQFLTQQMADLEKAAGDLRQIIAELDRIMEQEFLKTFEAVAAEFKTYFRRMFNGGEAELILTEPDNLTNTGVEIVARPPGKRAQNLSMLSGGERSLTAAALIFSLLKTSPTPFCILDEVDAMLDEANVGRFRSVLEELAEEMQIIVITHNRRTVEAANTIYGISMGEDSASRVLSLRLSEVE